MPWICLDKNGQAAHNAFNRSTYNGINQLLLSFIATKKSYARNAWLTFNQISKAGGTVLKGEKSSPVYFWSVLYYENGVQLDEETIRSISKEEFERRKIKKVSLLKYFPVFNVFQTSGLNPELYENREIAELTAPEKDDLAESFIHGTNASILYKAGNGAYYNPMADNITLPLREQFKIKESFYDTILHELGHWTGYPGRMNRELHGKFGSEKSAFEELVAELFSAFTCSHLGFNKSMTNNAAYIKNWNTALQNDTSYIFKASKLAEKALESLKITQETPV